MKDFITINSGHVILTKVNPLTGALSTDAKDKRICTEACDKITRSKSIESYDIPDGNSNYPAGTYEIGSKYVVGINLTNISTETLAFLQNSVITKAAGNVKEFVKVMIPESSPYEITTLGTIVGDPVVIDSENAAFEKATSPTAPTASQYGVSVGVESAPDKIVFNAADAGKTVTLVYSFSASEVESYDIEDGAINPVVQIEIIHETLSADKTKRYKNNSTVSRAQLTGNIDENLAKQHEAIMLNFTAVKPAGTKVVTNKKTEIPL